MAHGPWSSAGRPGSALLILGAIFATALIVRLPFGPAPVEQPDDSTLAATTLDLWSALPITQIEQPAITLPELMKVASVTPAPPIEAIRVASTASAATTIESERLEVAAKSPGIVSQSPAFVAEPLRALASTPHSHMAELAVAVTPTSYVESSSSNPFSAVGTAFVKTGAALTLAFKKTGQGILAPF